MKTDILLRVENLIKHFPVCSGFFGKTRETVRAVDGVSFTLKKGETLGLAGESGCGKTTVGLLLLHLLEADHGDIRFKNSPNLLTLSPSAMRPYRKHLQMIFQDPYSSLNPRLTIGSILSEPLKIFSPMLTRRERQARCVALLQSVGLSAEHQYRYPHEFSGGQRQRIGIARALSVQPELIVADEPVSALDVSIQAQILNLLLEVKNSFGVSFLFIAHNLAVVRHLCDRTAIMYLGKIVESAPTETLFTLPKHPYTRALLEAIPIPDPSRSPSRTQLEGDVPNPIRPPQGCRFHPRCPFRFDPCDQVEPVIQTLADQIICCHLYDPNYHTSAPESIMDLAPKHSFY